MELLGLALQVIVSEAARGGTIHFIMPAPIRGDYPTRPRYEAALARWQRTQCWTATGICDTVGNDSHQTSKEVSE